MQTLIIRHIGESDPSQLRVVRRSDGKSTDGVEVPSPVGFAVEGLPESDLMGELRWYLEDFLTYPFPPETEHAEHLTEAFDISLVEALEHVSATLQRLQVLMMVE